MADRALPSPELLRQLLRYEPEPGKLFWRQRPEDMFSSAAAAKAWNCRFAHTEAFTSLKDGYRVGRIFGALLRAHRVIVAMQTDAWPVAEIDHRDGRKDDNRWSMLRPASHEENTHNRSAPCTNTSGFKGVSQCPNGRWRTQITAFGIRHHLGYFSAAEDAARAYRDACDRLHGAFARPE